MDALMIETIKGMAQNHVAYHWVKNPWGDWTDEQKKIYNEKFDKCQKEKQKVI